MSNTYSYEYNGKLIELVPVNRNLAGDFIGFTFDDIHSSDFNLIRVSNGSRYENDLLPSSQDSTVQGEGKDGTYYFGSVFKERTIKFSTAFDQLTEENYRELVCKFSDKKLHKLWFDETPYKVHYVKIKQSPSFKNLCFEEENNKRVYKGEMDLEFICYPAYALARCPYFDSKLLDDEFILVANFLIEKRPIYHNHVLVGRNEDQKLEETETTETEKELEPIENNLPYGQIFKYYGRDGAKLSDSYNAKEWKTASRLEEAPQDNSFSLYNPGDIEADIKIIYTPLEGNNQFPNCLLGIKKGNIEYERKKIGIKSFELKEEDKKIAVDSRIHLITGLNDDEEYTRNVYNKYHIKGDFFEIPQSSLADGLTLDITVSDSEQGGDWKVEYKFYYV